MQKRLSSLTEQFPVKLYQILTKFNFSYLLLWVFNWFFYLLNVNFCLFCFWRFIFCSCFCCIVLTLIRGKCRNGFHFFFFSLYERSKKLRRKVWSYKSKSAYFSRVCRTPTSKHSPECGTIIRTHLCQSEHIYATRWHFHTDELF